MLDHKERLCCALKTDIFEPVHVRRKRTERNNYEHNDSRLLSQRKTDESAAFFADKRTDHREPPLSFLWMVLHEGAQTNNYQRETP
jgi:hypothetical protein